MILHDHHVIQEHRLNIVVRFFTCCNSTDVSENGNAPVQKYVLYYDVVYIFHCYSHITHLYYNDIFITMYVQNYSVLSMCSKQNPPAGMVRSKNKLLLILFLVVKFRSISYHAKRVTKH
uniref:Uncharacterized protein n=1 Tax=Cacopsylla melanoneura TaxID=428564 RepID=A0A8D8ZQH5_9HEMI